MSRIGKLPVEVPNGTNIEIEDQSFVAKGPKGELAVQIMDGFNVVQKENRIEITPKDDSKELAQFWGLQRTLIGNTIKGVSEGFSKTLEVNGVGFRVSLQGNKLVLNLGFSHPVEYITPEGIDLKVEQTTITVSGVDKQKVGSVAAAIREFKKPEPYKGKGIRYQDEVVRRKAGKTAAKTAG